MEALDRISVDPAVMGGRPCVKGTRVTVATLVGLLATGASEERLLKLYPYVTIDDVRQCLAYAALRVGEHEIVVS